MFGKRLRSFAVRWFLGRSLPHGLISWRYLAPRGDRKVSIHRRLWLLARPSRMPRPLFLLIESLLWVRWVSFACWRYSWLAVRRWGATVSESEGIGKARQFRTVLSLSLLHCIPPSEIYLFGLYRIGTTESLWDYIFTNECGGFHQWRNARLGNNRQSLTLLQDKLGLTDLLKAQGIPMAPVLGVVPRGQTFDPESWLQRHPRIFCKPRHGSGGRKAIVVDNHTNIFETRQGAATRKTTLAAARKTMAEDDYLVQPFLESHPELVAPEATDDAVTLRLITESREDHAIRCYFAALEMPYRADEAKNVCHVILPIEPSTGRVMRFSEHGRLSPSARRRSEECHARLVGLVVPSWGAIRNSAVAAHQCFPDVYAIAWDYIITPNGPYMLEGNTGWGTATSQMLHGGLLKSKPPGECSADFTVDEFSRC